MRYYRARMQIFKGNKTPRVLECSFEAGNIVEAQKLAYDLEIQKSKEMHVGLKDIFLSYFDDTQYFMAAKGEA